tara:strand:+ start:5634 stop:7163 length:1530 start_codon:yes stop_codon:yes gene_type:complete
LCYKFPYKDINSFSKLILDYLDNDERITPFINHFPKIENFSKQIKEKKRHDIDRDLLVKVLKKQNSTLALSNKSEANIDLLKLKTTFSVTTGHQLCLFTGPLYFIYKIISAINLCEQLSGKYPENNFVPIFWLASEDHDFREVNHIHLYGKKIEWKSVQTGAVGRMKLDGLKDVISELRLALGSHKHAPMIISFFEKIYLGNETLADATRSLVNELFGSYGLVIIDGNDKDLKRQFIPQIRKDIINKGFFAEIQNCSNNLAKEYHTQAYVRRDNFFRLSSGSRELITEDVSVKYIEKYFDKFSPNVLLRPLYQEVVLPNISYVGGGAEIAYWMQLKKAFSQEMIPFPILVLRNSALLIDNGQQKVLKKLGLRIRDVFLSEDVLKKNYILTNANASISLEGNKKELESLYNRIKSRTLDAGLQNSIISQLQRQLSFLGNIQEKMIRSEKKKNTSAINQISKIKSQLFPTNGLQERYNNFIPYYFQDGDNFIETLKNNFDPLNPNFVVLKL